MQRRYTDGAEREGGETSGDRTGRSSPRAESAEGFAGGIAGCEICQLTQGTSTRLEHQGGPSWLALLQHLRALGRIRVLHQSDSRSHETFIFNVPFSGVLFSILFVFVFILLFSLTVTFHLRRNRETRQFDRLRRVRILIPKSFASSFVRKVGRLLGCFGNYLKGFTDARHSHNWSDAVIFKNSCIEIRALKYLKRWIIQVILNTLGFSITFSMYLTSNLLNFKYRISLILFVISN